MDELCKHDEVEKDVALVDGYCPLCLLADIAALEARLQEAEAVIKPFADDDFCRSLSGNVEGDKSPVFGRGVSILTLGDFRRAAAWLKGGTE